MTFNRAKLKREAKLSIHNTKPHAVLVSLVLVIIVLILQVLTMNLNGDIAAIRDTVEEVLAAGYTDITDVVADMQNGTIQVRSGEGAVGFGGVLTFLIELMATVLSVGYSLYALRVSRGEKASVGDIFDAFGLFFRAILVSMIPSILVSLWMCVYILPVFGLVSLTGSPVWLFLGLPLLIPAIRASYSYRQAVFIMVDYPQLNPLESVALSKAVMVGHRWELFKLDLSFLGWQILQTFVAPVYLWVLPYTRVAQAHYYNYVTGEFNARNGEISPFRKQENPGGDPPEGTGGDV